MPSKKPQSQLSESSIQPVAIAKLRRDGGTQPRAQLYGEVVAEYAEDMKQDAEFPPVTVFFDGEEYWLADGFHRVSAKELIGETGILSDVRPGTQRDAVLYAAGANATHGLRRTNADKRRAVERLLHDFEWSLWSDNAVAKKCGVSHSFVGKMRNELGLKDSNSPSRLRIGMDKRVIDTSKIGSKSLPEPKDKTKRQRAKKQVSQTAPKPLVVQLKEVAKGDTWKLGKSHYLFCGDSDSSKFQRLLPSEISLLLIFPQSSSQWPKTMPTSVNSVLFFYTAFREEIRLDDLRPVIEKILESTTDAGDVVLMVNLPDPSIFILMDKLECSCYCAETDPQRCTDALTAWSITKQPSKKI